MKGATTRLYLMRRRERVCAGRLAQSVLQRVFQALVIVANHHEAQIWCD